MAAARRPTVTVSTRLPYDLDAQLTRRAALRGVPRSQLLAELVEREVGEPEGVRGDDAGPGVRREA